MLVSVGGNAGGSVMLSEGVRGSGLSFSCGLEPTPDDSVDWLLKLKLKADVLLKMGDSSGVWVMWAESDDSGVRVGSGSGVWVMLAGRPHLRGVLSTAEIKCK